MGKCVPDDDIKKSHIFVPEMKKDFFCRSFIVEKCQYDCLFLQLQTSPNHSIPKFKKF